MFRVMLTACVAGNPNQAWKLRLPPEEHRPDEPNGDRVPPNDVWEEQAYPFDDLEAAKAFIRGLAPETTTGVVLDSSDDGATWERIFTKDADASHLDAAGPGVVMPHTIDSELPVGLRDEPVEEVPPLLPSQGAAQ